MEHKMVQYLADKLAGIFNRPIKLLEPIPVPSQSYDPNRRQCLSTEILKTLLATAPTDTSKILGITEVDLFIPIFTYVFGEAQLGGRVALVSLARLKPEHSDLPCSQAGEPQNDEQYNLRALKEAIHELGHTFSLTHCTTENCVMTFANNLIQIDMKDYRFCPSCAELIKQQDLTD
jgi:archaemetzincin